MRSHRLSKAVASIFIALTLMPTFALFTALPTAYAQQQQLPGVALVKVWSVDYSPYMAKFYGEDYVVVCTLHCDVSLDGRFISSWGTAYIYKVKTGELLGSLTGPGTWSVFSWDPFKATKVSSYTGFFSADSMMMVPDLRAHGGTNVKGVYTTSTWCYIPIDWGFTDTAGSNFYAEQLDYEGNTLAVGYIAASKLLVYKYSQTQYKYVKVYEYKASGDYGRRLQMTLRGDVIVVGGLNYPYLDIHVYDYTNMSYSLAVHYKIPDTGIGALGISDPYNVGYIIAGGQNGWVIIAKYDPLTNNFTVVYQAKLATSRFYNPFYDRWIPRVTEVFALCTTTGEAVVYDVLTNTSIKISESGYAAAISPEANYVFIGKSLYMVLRRDVQARAPRARLWGTLVAEYPLKPLNTSIVLTPPKGLDVLMFSGKVTISKIYTESIPVDLVTDPDIVRGRLATMADKGLISASTLRTEYSEVQALSILKGYEFREDLAAQGVSEYDNYIATVAAMRFTPPPYFAEGNTYFGTVIRIPLSQSLRLFNDMRLELASSIHTASLLYDKNKRALAALGIPVEIGGGVGVSALAYSKIADSLLLKLAVKEGIVNLEKAFGIATSQTVAKIAGVVGIAVAVWGGIDAALVTWGGLGEVNTQSWIVIAPTVVDKYGRRFTAVMLYLPLEESPNIKSYYDIIKTYFRSLGYTDVGLQVTYVGQTWDEYRRRLEAGFTPVVNLYELIRTTIAAQYSLDMDTLTAAGVDILIVTRVRARETFWEWFFGLGGVNINTLTLIGASAIKVKGVLKAGVVTDPATIVNILGKVYVNDVDYALGPGADGAYTVFGIQLGIPEIVFRFEQPQGFYGDIRVEITIAVKSVFKDTGYSYTTTLNYSWEGTQVILSKIELVDMPRPAVMIERVFRYAYGEFAHDITKYFTLQTTVNDPSSPTGKLYYYITTSTLLFDPTNGGILQPGKSYTINYYYRTPPDVSIKVFLNGTRVTSSLAHHATVLINNSAPAQDIYYTLYVAVKVLRAVDTTTTEVPLLWHTVNDSASVAANKTFTKTYDISWFVYQAAELMRSGTTAYVEVVGRIVNATYNFFKYNDEYRVVYYPPATVAPSIPEGNYTVTIYVFEFSSKEYRFVPSAGALVRVLRGFEEVFRGYTNASGVVATTLSSGTYTFEASKPGFKSCSTTLTVVSNTIVNLYLAPVEKPLPPTPTPVNVTVKFFVYNATSGMPVANALVSATLVEPLNSSYYGMSFTAYTNGDGWATIVLPMGRYRVEVSAAGFEKFVNTYLFDSDAVVNVPLVPTGLVGYYTLTVLVFYKDMRPYTGANVTVVNGGVSLALQTNSFGNATFVLRGGVEYRVTVSVAERVYNRSYTETKTVLLDGSKLIAFVLPWESGVAPPQQGLYWLAVQVLWANGLPFHSAEVSVYNYTTNALIDRGLTNGTGIAWFLLPAFKLYTVRVYAVNPYNTSQVHVVYIVLNLTENKLVGIRLPWLPQEAELAQRIRLVAFAYDALTGSGVADAIVVARRGDLVWSAKTNEAGFADLWLPYTGWFNVTALHPKYMAVWRTIVVVENNTRVNIPMTPAATRVLPPINGTYMPPVYIDTAPHWWLSVQVLWSDGFPFHNATVTVYDAATNAVIASGVTNGTGFVHFLIRNGTSIKYTVYAVNPYNTSQVYSASRSLVMNQHYYFVHIVPWRSRYFQPEVAVVGVELAIHRGQGYYYGNVSHCIVYSIWTNTPQNVTVLLALYDFTSTPPRPLNSKTVRLSLAEGVNVFMDWLSVNITRFTTVRALVNITAYQYDTDPSNNYMWSKPRTLKPFTDFRIVVLWRPKVVKQSWTLLPEDIIEIDIGVYIPINTTSIPLRLDYSISAKNLTLREFRHISKRFEEIRALAPGVIWRNFTVSVPWTSKVVVNASIYSELDDVAANNNISIAIPVDPNIRLTIAKYTSYAFEGSDVSITVFLKSNVEAEVGAIAWITVEDNKTATIVKRVEVSVEPEKTVEVRFKAPQNPPAVWFIRKPAETHTLTVSVAGYDVYLADNSQSIEVTVLSYQWLGAVVAVVAIIILIAAIARVLRKSIEMGAEEEMEFVKRKRYVHSKS